MFLILSRALIRNNWDVIKRDPDNPRPDIETPDEFISAIEGGMIVLGAKVILQDEIPNAPLSRERSESGSSG